MVARICSGVTLHGVALSEARRDTERTCSGAFGGSGVGGWWSMVSKGHFRVATRLVRPRMLQGWTWSLVRSRAVLRCLLVGSMESGRTKVTW